MEFGGNYEHLENRNRILHYIFENQNVTRPVIAKALDLSLPTVLQNTNELIADNLVTEVGERGIGSGRKAKILGGVSNAAYAFGIDISQNHVAFLCADLQANILDFNRIRLKFANNANYYKAVGEELVRFAAKQSIPQQKILGVGIAVPALVTEDGTHTNGTEMLLPRNENISVNFFKQYIPYPCCFINDANAAVTAELYKDDERRTSAVYLSLSSGVGGAIIVNGALYKGDEFKSGEFGHTILVPNGRKCFCGARGCAQMYLNSSVLSKETDGNLEEFFSEIDNNEKLSKIWDSYLMSLSILVHNLHMTFNCTIILGGYVGGYIGKYLPQLTAKLKEIGPTSYSDFSYAQAGRIEMAASALGAALIYVRDFLDNA